MDELTKRVKNLHVGKTIYVFTETDRQQVLRVAKMLGVVIATRRSISTTSETGFRFSCTRLPARD